MIYEIDLSPLTVALLAVNVVAALFLCTVYRGRIRRVVNHGRSLRCPGRDEQLSYPGISVIVYDRDSTESLSRLLPDLLTQDYPADFEVIVVTDGRSEAASDMVNMFSAEYRNLRLTFVPDEAHALSRKKLAITLGMKAAKYDYVLLTDADVIVQSRGWLLSIGRHFAEGKEVVIGHAYPVDRQGRSGVSTVAFDSLADAVTALSSAIGGRPYRGSEKNLAFKRSLFFENKGFAGSVGFHHGEDDIFVSSIADSGNTSVELAPQAQVAVECYDLRSQHREQKLRHMFTGRFVSRTSRRIFGLSSLMMWIWLVSTAVSVLITFPNLMPLSVAVAVGAVWMAVVTVSWSAASHVLSIRVVSWGMPVLMFVRPISTIIYRIRAMGNRGRNYTWSKP